MDTQDNVSIAKLSKRHKFKILQDGVINSQFISIPSSIVIHGKAQINGELLLPGDKISAVHLIFASLLCDGPVKIYNLPLCGDVLSILNWFYVENLAQIEYSDTTNAITISPALTQVPTLNKIEHIRASICLAAPLVLKYGETNFGHIGGCNFTDRPIDHHLNLLKAFGIEFNKYGGQYVARLASKKSIVQFDCSTQFGPSVGVTAHALMAALVFDGEITLTNVALEPVIDILLKLITSCSSRKIVKKGRIVYIEPTNLAQQVTRLKEVSISLSSDFTIMFTYLAFAIATNGEIMVTHVTNIPLFIFPLLEQIGLQYKVDSEQKKLWIKASSVIHPKSVVCKPWPGIPSDIAPVLLAALAPHQGVTKITDTVYVKRSTHVEGLGQMGYNVSARGNTTYVRGATPDDNPLTVFAHDIRCGASLAIGALARCGVTTINGYEQIFRGYPDLIGDLHSLGVSCYGKSNERSN